jgi:hypothetical protein
MDKTTAIFHYVAVPESVIRDRNRSFFQGFSIPVMRGFSGIMNAISMFPNDFSDIFLDDKGYLASKMCGSSIACNFLRVSLIDNETLDLYNGLTVVWSNEHTSQQVATIIKKCKRTPIHISSGEFGDVKLENIKKENINEIIAKWIAKNNLIKEENLEKYLPKNRTKKKLEFDVRGHFAFRPNLTMLADYGFDLGEVSGFVGISTNDYINEIIRHVAQIDSVRSSTNVPKFIVKNDAIIYCNAMYTFLYDWNSHFWNDIRREIPKKAREILKDSIVKNKGYSNFTVELDDPEEMNEIFSSSKAFASLNMHRSLENQFFSQVMTALALSEFCPAIRLPNGVMHFHSQLKDIISSVTSSSKLSLENINKKMRNYSDAIKKLITPNLLNSCFQAREKIIAVCDFPIEWIAIDAVPIMFTKEISRISPTPGDLFLQTAVSFPKVSISSEYFQEVLIIRSFSHDDPVGIPLTEALKHYENNVFKNLKYRIINVKTQEEIISALNSHQGAIVVFDCHGGHDGEMGSGWLAIGKTKVDTWSLANSCNIPPIVILSACSTHAPDGSHASVANGFLRCGTLSVIGTYAPINTNHAAIFVCRLLHRVSEYIPVAAKHRPITWRKVVSDFFKLSYVTDILYDLHFRLKLITTDSLQKIQFESHKIIESNVDQWELLFFAEIIKNSSIKKEQWNELLIKYYQYVETMLYTQLGRPEQIAIHNPQQKDIAGKEN